MRALGRLTNAPFLEYHARRARASKPAQIGFYRVGASSC